MTGWVHSQIGQVSLREPCSDLLHTANDLSQTNPVRKQIGNLPRACEIAKPEQSFAGVKQPEADKLIDGTAGESRSTRQCGRPNRSYSNCQGPLSRSIRESGARL